MKLKTISTISPSEIKYNDKIDLYVESPKHLIRGQIVKISNSRIFLDFGTKQLVSIPRKTYFEMLTQIFIIMNVSYMSTTRSQKLSREFKKDLNNWLKKKVKIGESISVKLSSIDSMKNIASINVKDTLDYIKTSKLFYELEQIKRFDKKIKGFILNSIKGGFSVAIGGIVGFLPAREVLKVPNRKLSHKFVNTSTYLKISKITFDTRNVILKKA